MRKDYQEAYYVEEAKPFGNRWPEGKVYRSEDRTEHFKNVRVLRMRRSILWLPEG